MHPRPITIAVAGLGTRLRSATKAVSKAPLNVCHRPVLQFAKAEAIEGGPEGIAMVMHPGTLAIRDYFRPDNDYIGWLIARRKTMPGAALATCQVPDPRDLAFAFPKRRFGPGHAISRGFAKLHAWFADSAPSARRLDGQATSLKGTRL